MSLRLTAPSEDILGANYKITKIVASDYNPNIDSTITVTVTVKDVYDDPVENESVRIVYSDIQGDDTPVPNVKRKMLTFDIYVKIEDLHNVGEDRLAMRTQLIANRLIQLLS